MTIASKRWTKKRSPKRILVIRLQAMGDVVITLPYLQHLRNNLHTEIQIDLLTRVETNPIPGNLILFNKIFSIAGKRNLKAQLFFTLLLLPRLFIRQYDIVIDLQNNIISRLVRKFLNPPAWAEFDRTSPVPAGVRTKNTIEAIGLVKNDAAQKLHLKNDLNAKQILMENGWNQEKDIIVLNPAGVFETRNWPVENYLSFANMWLEEFPKTQFLVLGLSSIGSKAEFLKNKLGENIICIIDKTNVAEAFSILQYTKLMLSEDSGLMHMSWVSGIPTFTLLGGTRPDRAQPLGRHSAFLDSSDLECGCCMQEKCKWGATRCLTRYSPGFVFEKVKALLNQAK
jgi:heptosyltransferase II